MDRARRIASNSLLVTDYGHPDTWGANFQNVRVVVAHMIVETATHAGHLDATAELLDGRQQLVMDRTRFCREDGTTAAAATLLQFSHGPARKPSPAPTPAMQT